MLVQWTAGRDPGQYHFNLDDPLIQLDVRRVAVRLTGVGPPLVENIEPRLGPPVSFSSVQLGVSP